MKYTFSTLGTPAYDFDQVIALAVRHSFDGLELRGIRDELDADAMTVLKKEARRETKRKASDNGLSIHVIDCSAAFHDRTAHARSYEECAFAIEAAADMGAPFIRVFGNSIPEEREEDEVINCVAEGISRVARCAHGTGVTVLLEVHGDFVNTRRLTRVLSLVNDPSFALLWDAEHTENDDFEGMYRAIAPFIRHVHLKDRTRDGKLCLPGKGILPLVTIRDLLEKTGYRGAISLEWEKRWHAELPEADEAAEAFMGLMKA